ncbi:hypothetical protein M413DRAFT_26063 [Hebeloma cylindrosporum]|uniref:Uncharacterized protein n=1 Tax=Hebeloma cylindrosporum TaxID=76867 RepID=A0A0C3C4G7_HEBCY|nr:hypothetical protein M413DRAFT_26063 [Hebeloma cylindrosporum h7]
MPPTVSHNDYCDYPELLRRVRCRRDTVGDIGMIAAAFKSATGAKSDFWETDERTPGFRD